MGRSRETGPAGRGRARTRGGPGDEGRRPERVAAEIQRVLAELLLRRSKDPRLAQVSVTRVDLTPDLRLARIAYTVLDDRADRREVQRALDRATPFLKRGVGAGLALRYVPDLVFAYDVALEGARRIDALLRGLKAPEGEEATERDPSPAEVMHHAGADDADEGEEESET